MAGLSFGSPIGYPESMWLNQQTIDAIRIMAELAMRWPHLARASDLVDVTGISFVNIQKTAHALAQSGLIETARGRHGGMRLQRPAEGIHVGEIVRAFEPQDCPVNFLMASTVDSAIASLLFQAHRGFFKPLEEMPLSELGAPGRSDAARRRLEV